MRKMNLRGSIFCSFLLGGLAFPPLQAHEMEGIFNPPLHHIDELTFLKTNDPLLDWKAARTWTASDGRKLKAKIVRAEGSTAIFILQNGKETPIPLERLSGEDQRFITEWREISAYFNTGYRKQSNLTGKVEAEIRDGAFAKDGKIHETRNFRFECDEVLNAEVVKDFSRLFEATYYAVKSLPLGLEAADAKDGKFLVKLFAKQADYLSAGGQENAAGIYLLKDREILVPLSSLGVTPGPRGFRKTTNYDPGTLIHETVHAVTHQWLNIVPLWFAEGLAEYVAAIPYRDGAFYLKEIDRGLVERAAKKFGGDAGRFSLVNPDDLVKLDDRVFMNEPEIPVEPIILPKVKPFQMKLLREGESPAPDPLPGTGPSDPDTPMGPSMTMTGGTGTKPMGIDFGGFAPPRPPEVDTPIVVQRYVSSMLLLDHLLKTGQDDGLRRYLFSFLHNTWDSINYLAEYRSTHKRHIANLDKQGAEFEQVLKDFNSEITAYNAAIDRYNARKTEEVPKKPSLPVAPPALEVPYILGNPRSADALSRKVFREGAAENVLNLPPTLKLPE